MSQSKQMAAKFHYKNCRILLWFHKMYWKEKLKKKFIFTQLIQCMGKGFMFKLLQMSEFFQKCNFNKA